MSINCQNACSDNGKSKSLISKPTLLEEIEAFTRIPSVVGREFPAAEFIRHRLTDLPVHQDALGNLILTFGSGEPRRLFVAPLDEPGYVISRIQDDGFLRITPVGSSFSYSGALAHQFNEGQKIIISTANGQIYGALTVPSTHLSRSRAERFQDGPPLQWQDTYIDVGVETVTEVGELGIRLLDPVTLIKRPIILQKKMIAAPSIQSKAACIALVDAARRLSKVQIKGTVVFAWTVLETLNGKGLETVLNSYDGVFNEAYIFSPTFGFIRQGRQLQQVELPVPDSGVLVDRVLTKFPDLIETQNIPNRSNRFRNPVFKDADIRFLGLPTRYQKTPVEMVHIEDVRKLANLWTHIAFNNNIKPSDSVPLLSVEKSIPQSKYPHSKLANMVSGLIAKYGVSRSETPVRKYIETLLPGWMQPKTDQAGNLTVTFGSGEEHIMFVAHMDETGFVVRSIREDGRLILGGRPGYSWLWEAQAASVHTIHGDIPAIFEPRKDYFQAERHRFSEPVTVYLGVDSIEEVQALGVKIGSTTVTMPKQMTRIGKVRILARSLDDRAGCAALILAASKIDPQMVKRRITFAWSTGEEIGLVGAQTLAENYRDVSIVYPVDTFVSSDAPSESKINAYCPLGKGAVIRVLESSNFTPRQNVDELLSLARGKNIKVQIGNTFGGTDGGPFVIYGIPSLPISWPGRYSHSPIEVLDLRDLDALMNLIMAIIVE